MDAVAPGFVAPIHTESRIVVFLCKNKEINGVTDPDPIVFSCTPESILKLKQVTREQIVSAPQPEVNETYECFSVFDRFMLIWIRRSIFEGAFAGTSVTFSGPYLLIE